MADITAERIIIQQEETKFRAAVAESLMSRIGATNNFISLYQHDRKEFFINGPYRVRDFADGVHSFLYDAEIVGYSMVCTAAGSGGATRVELLRYPIASGGATILTTPPGIPSTAGAVATITEEFTPTAQVLEQTGASTLAVFNSVLINAGDKLVMNIIEAQTGYPVGLSLTLYHRPR